MNSVLELHRSVTVGARALRTTTRPVRPIADSRKARPNWLGRSVATNDDRGMAALVGVRPGG